MHDLICTDRLKRADAVTKARQAVYEAKIRKDQMSSQGIYVERYESLLNLAEAVEAEAVADLRKHRKDHGC